MLVIWLEIIEEEEEEEEDFGDEDHTSLRDKVQVEIFFLQNTGIKKESQLWSKSEL